MLVAFAFDAKPGKEAEFEKLLNDPATARRVAAAVGASRNTLFLAAGRMVRILEFPEGVKPRTLAEAAQDDPSIADFLQKLGPLIEGSPDLDDRAAVDAFNQRVALPMVFDVQPEVAVQQPSRVEM